MRQDLLDRLAGMPAFLEDAARRAGSRAKEPGPEGGFSLLEQAWHLADLEARGYGERIRRILSEVRPALPDFDGAREAREGRYRERDLGEGLAAFRRARSGNLATLRSLLEADWSRPATQEGVGELRLEDVPRMMAEHDASHRAEIRELLGEPPREDAPRSSRIATAFMLLLVVPLLGCPYEASFPIGAPGDAPRDPKLLGQWRCVGGSDDGVGLLAIEAVGEQQYSFSVSAPNEKPVEYRGHVAALKSTPVFNYQEVEEGKPKPSWGFVRYLMPTPNSLVLDIAEDELLKDLEQTPGAIGAALDGPRSSEIFTSLLVCVRVGAGGK